MVDDSQSAVESADRTCPWCSANYTGDPEICPSCGAQLSLDPATDSALPGLTAIDAAAIVRAKTAVPRQRNRLLSWISGDYPDDVQSSSEAGALAPPDLEVRREMLRLEHEAEVANLQAEADAQMSEASLESPTPSAPRAGDAGAVDVGATPDIAASANEAAVSDTEGPTPAA